MTQLPLIPQSDPGLQTLRDAAAAYLPTVHDLPADERPVNRLCHVGPAALSTGELIAILLGTPHQLMDAQRLIETFKGLPGIARAAFSELTHQHGIGPATAAKIQAALELGRRLITTSAHKEQIRSPADAAAMLIPEMSLLEREQLRVILLDTKNYLLGAPTIYVGSINTNLVRVAEIFHPAITHYAAAIIIVHNHPSGDPTPSPEDVTVTHKIIQTGKLMDIEVLDHIIIGQGRFVSLKERGLGFQ